MRLLELLAFGGIVLVLAGRLRWLTPSGQLAASIVGLTVLLGSGRLGVALLFVFFLSSSALSRIRLEGKGRAGEPGGRSAMQVVANPAAFQFQASNGSMAARSHLHPVSRATRTRARSSAGIALSQRSILSGRARRKRDTFPRSCWAAPCGQR